MHLRFDMDWDDFRYLLAVARHKTLKAAAQHLAVDQATVGRRIAALQNQMEAKLLEKRSDGYFLTNTGERIIRSLEVVENELLSVSRVVAGEDMRLTGVVKVAMPTALANYALIEALAPLFRAHPELEIQLFTGPELLDLRKREADIAIRLVRPEQNELKTKKLGSIRFALYAPKDKRPKENFAAAPFVGLFEEATSRPEKAFLKSLGFRPNYRLRSAAWGSVLGGIRAGIGIGILPTFIGDRATGLQLLRDHPEETPLWLVVHPEVARSARIKTTIEHITRALHS